MSTDAETGTANPYLRGNYAPVQIERTDHDLEITGRLPAALNGRLLRAGPNPAGPVGPDHHWFLGDGMIHGIEISEGRARTYRNRWVRTPSVEEARPELPAAGTVPSGAVNPSSGAVHVIEHGGHVLALGEVGLPYELTPELDTVGPHTFGGALLTSMTAHPKRDPDTGDLHFFGYDFGPVHLRYHRADAAGELVQTEVIDLPRTTMMHDFNITASRVVFMDLPVVFSTELLARQTMPFAWQPDAGARLGVMPLGGSGDDVRWFDIDPCYVFHPLNAFDDGDRIVLDVVRYDTMFAASTIGPEGESSQLWRWVIDPTSGAVSQTRLDDRPAEFPRVPDALVGRRHRFGYGVAMDASALDEAFDSEGLIKWDLDKGDATLHPAGDGRFPSEGVFVADPDGTAEDDGWVLSVVYDAATDRSDVIVVDARDFDGSPVATVHLPVRVPFGFHGSWLPAT
ncbi:MAG: carotenoid oxygenase family protein [Acidimicrobiales bacterium]|nr:carotenoid oxygenase family protein [Acidimicrobiales bacterium]